MADPMRTFLDWLTAMDEPDNEAGMKARQGVTLSRIIDHARDVSRWIELAESTGDAGVAVLTGAAPRLWQVDHPYYGADGYENKVSSFAELRAMVDGMDEDMNVVYRWDWNDYREPHHDDPFGEGEHRDKQEFTVYWLMPRKEKFGSVTCPVTHDQENEIVEWLRGPRCTGYLLTLWAPILGAGAR